MASRAKEEIPPAAAIDREIGLRGSFHDFVGMAWSLVEPAHEFVDNWHIGAICEHMQAVHAGQIKRLVINIPPGCMKSLTVSVFYPAWAWIRTPGRRLIFASYDSDLVGKRDGSKVLDIVRSPWFRQRWGDRVIIRGKDPSFFDFETTQRGSRFATSVGGKLMGRHGNDLIVDDPIKPQGISDASLADAKRWKQETTASRLLPGGAIVIMMQRLHEKDLAGEAEAEGGWEFLRLPMRYESAQHCTTSLGFSDPRKTEGELLFPQFKDETEVADTEKNMGGKESNTVAAQLQQRPSPAQGLLFKAENFQHYKVLPERFDFIVDSWDCTFKDLESSDFVVGQRWGVVGTNYYLFPYRVRARLSFSNTLKAVEEFHARDAVYKPMATLVEDKANGTAVINVMGQKIPGFIAVNPEGGKVVRATAVTPLYEAHNVWHPDPSIAPWIEDHESELKKFPKGKNDDSVDSETQALTYLRSKASSFLAAMEAIMKGDAQWLTSGST